MQLDIHAQGKYNMRKNRSHQVNMTGNWLELLLLYHKYQELEHSISSDFSLLNHKNFQTIDKSNYIRKRYPEQIQTTFVKLNLKILYPRGKLNVITHIV